MTPYSAEIARAINAHLEDCGMKLVGFDANTGTFGFVMNLTGRVSFIHCLISVHQEDYTVIAMCPLGPEPGDSAALTAIAEFIARANHGLKNGNFELNFRDGELYYKSYVDCRGRIPSQRTIANSIYVPAAMMDRYAPGIVNVLCRGMSAETAVEDCEFSLSRFPEPGGFGCGVPRMHHRDDPWERDYRPVTAKPGEYADFPDFEEFFP